MPRKLTKGDLETRVHALSAYQEAFFAIQAGCLAVEFSSGDWTVEYLGAERSSGGVIIQGSMVSWVRDWRVRIGEHADPHLRELARRVEKHEASEARRRDFGKEKIR